MPGAGAPPPELAGRQVLLSQADILFQRARPGRVPRSFVATGLRGVGKTVLLHRVGQIARDHGWRLCQIEAHEKKPLPLLLVPALRRMLLELDRLGPLSEPVKRALRVLMSFASGLSLRHGDTGIQLDIEPEPGSADSGNLEADLPQLIVALGRAAASRQAAIVLTLDEIQHLPEVEMSALILSLHRVVQEALPIVLVAAGLPQVATLSGRSRSCAEQLFDFPRIGALSPDDARLALSRPALEEGVRFTGDALDAIVATTGGYPYFLQEWGYHAWNAAAGDIIGAGDVERASVRAWRALDTGFFRIRYDGLTPREKFYCRAMAALGTGTHRSADIALRLGTHVQAVAPLRDGLIRKGVVYSPAHGDVAFATPLFEPFLDRIQPPTSSSPTSLS